MRVIENTILETLSNEVHQILLQDWRGVEIRIKIFLTRTPAPQRGRGVTPGTPYGADLNNLSELTRRGFRNPWRLRFYLMILL